MKKIILAILGLSCMGFSFNARSQQVPEKLAEQEQQEIIIRSNGDNDITLKVEIKGDKLIINGQPLVDFKKDSVTITARKIIVHNGGENMTLDFKGLGEMNEMLGLKNKELEKAQREFAKINKRFYHKTFLGVTTEKINNGAKIVEILKGSAAEKAGLKIDDIITKIGNEQVTDGEVLANIIASKKPKDEIKIYYERENKKKVVKVVLGEKVESMAMNYKLKYPKAMIRGFNMPAMPPIPPLPPMVEMNMEDNFNLDENDDLFADAFPRQKKLGLKIQDTEEGGNVKIIEVEDSSAAEKAGLKKDDIITEINTHKINNTDDARKQLQEVANKSTYTIKAKRNETEMSFDIKIPKKLKTANL